MSVGVKKGMQVVSYNKKYVFEHHDGKVEEIAPVVIESCMNPGQKKIVPVTYVQEEGNEAFVVSNTYKTIEVYDEKDYKAIYTEDYEPKIEKHSCSQCTNCGRC